MEKSRREGDDENPEDVSIGGLDLDSAFEEGLPFVDELIEFVSGHCHSVKRSHAVLSVDFVNDQLDLSPSPSKPKESVVRPVSQSRRAYQA